MVAFRNPPKQYLSHLLGPSSSRFHKRAYNFLARNSSMKS